MGASCRVHGRTERRDALFEHRAATTAGFTHSTAHRPRRVRAKRPFAALHGQNIEPQPTLRAAHLSPLKGNEIHHLTN